MSNRNNRIMMKRFPGTRVMAAVGKQTLQFSPRHNLGHFLEAKG